MEVYFLANRKKNKQLKFRANPKDHKKIKAKIEKSGLTQNEFLLRSALDKKIIRTGNLTDLRVELKRIGNNINQIARKINQGKILEGVEKEKFSEELEKVQTAQNKIYDKLEKIMR